MNHFIFTSARLGFKIWDDIACNAMIKISAHPEVMRYFPVAATPQQTIAFVERKHSLYKLKNYCYFAVVELASNQTIGFIGLNDPTYEAEFLPNVDIGWRLHPNYWGKGYATEGAIRCLQYGFEVLNLPSIIATAPKVNIASIQVMKKIGMKEKTRFKHSRMKNHSFLADCVCYEINQHGIN